MKLADLLGNLAPEFAPKRKRLSRHISGLERITKAYAAYIAGEKEAEAYVRFSPSAADVALFASIQHTIKFEKMPGHEFIPIYRSRFLNELIANCHEDQLTIAVQYQLCGLLSNDDPTKKKYNLKELSVYGKIGGGACEDLASGIVHLYGNAQDRLCAGMKGGEVILHGSATQRAGNNLRGGILRIEGSAGHDLGMNAKKGIIYAKRAQSFGLNARQRVTFHLQEPSPMSNHCRATVYVAGKKVSEGGHAI